MQFLMIYTPDDPSPATLEKVIQLGRFGVQAGSLAAAGAMYPSGMGARVRLSTGAFSVTDGPFPGAKEVMAGWVILKAGSKAEAIEQARRFMTAAGDGETEIRQLTD